MAIAGIGRSRHSAHQTCSTDIVYRSRSSNQGIDMLVQILIHQPRMLGTIIQHTPAWVWVLLCALLALGVSQSIPRRASQTRTTVLPAAMAVFALLGLVTAFAGVEQRILATAVWLVCTLGCTALALWLRPAAPAAIRFDGATRQFALPGSAWPLLMILGIFLTKYGVGVELALQPTLAGDPVFALGVAAVYGMFNGIFTARFVRLWRLTRSRA